LLITAILPNTIISAESYIDVIYILTEIAMVVFCGWMSYLLYTMKVTKPPGRPFKPTEAPLLIKLINDLQSEHGTTEIDAIKITDKFSLDIIRTPKNGFPVFFFHHPY